MVEIEKYNAKDSLDAHKRERHFIEQLNATLNKQVPTRTRQEYYKDNYNSMSKNMQILYIKNKDKIKEKVKQYYKENEEKIKHRKTTLFKCPCGSEIQHDKKSRHNRTKKHTAFIASQQKLT